MRNVMIYYCQSVAELSDQGVADKLGITLDEFAGLTAGGIPLTYEQADQLGDIFHLEPIYFWLAGQQLAALRECLDIIVVIQNGEKETYLLQQKEMLGHLETQKTVGTMIEKVRRLIGENILTTEKLTPDQIHFPLIPEPA